MKAIIAFSVLAVLFAPCLFLLQASGFSQLTPRSTELFPQLFCAAENDDLRVIEATLKERPMLSCAMNSNGQTVLHVAIRNGAANVVDYLLLFGVDPTIRDEKNNTPLALAEHASKNRQQIVASVLTALNLHNTFFQAIANQDVNSDDVEDLIERQPALLLRVDSQGRKPVDIVKANGREDLCDIFYRRLVMMLLQAVADERCYVVQNLLQRYPNLAQYAEPDSLFLVEPENCC